MNYKKAIAALISIEGVSQEEIEASITATKDAANGDYCLPCFRYSKQLRKSPQQIADALAAEIALPDFLEKIQSVAGYLNFTVEKSALIKDVLTKVLDEKEAFGRSDEGGGRVICIDYSSVNIAKPFHIGHLSSTAIGAALYRIYGFLGYKPIGINHLGDWGTQFGKLIVAYKLWGSREDVERRGVAALLEIYVRFHKEAETDGDLDNQARWWFKRIEEGDGEAMSLFEWFKKLTLAEVSKVYERLNIKFDYFTGESFYNDKMQPVLDELSGLGLLTKSDGAEVIMLDKYNMPPCLLVKADGATLYATRDIAAAFYRKQTYNFYKSLYVVAYQQNLHFKQWFKVVELMGKPWASGLEHVAFGMVSLPDGAIKTRAGNVVFLEDVINRAVEKSLEVINEKSPDLAGKETVAEQVGIGAVVFSVLYNNRIKDIVFNYDKVLNFEGETGPYCQYTHARCCSVLARAAIGDEKNFSGVNNAEGAEVVKILSRFPETVREAAEANEPSYIGRFTVDLAQAYNKFYIGNRIIDAPEGIKNARLMLTDAVRQTLSNALSLLGIAAPVKM